VVTDGAGTPLAIEVTAGQVHESTIAESVIGQAVARRIGRIRRRRKRRYKPRKLAGDKGYSVQRLRDWLAGHGIKPVIAHRLSRASIPGRIRTCDLPLRRRLLYPG
jgi:hypothetical protein